MGSFLVGCRPSTISSSDIIAASTDPLVVQFTTHLVCLSDEFPAGTSVHDYITLLFKKQVVLGKEKAAQLSRYALPSVPKLADFRAASTSQMPTATSTKEVREFS